MGCAVASGHTLGFFVPSAPPEVVEWYNGQSGHYFLTASATEISAIEAGLAGPGWSRTGYGFLACPAGLCRTEVSRFFRPPGPGVTPSHFFTASAAETDSLKRPGSGWIFEGMAFNASVPDESAACATPVYRLYGSGPQGDHGHRYVTSPAERDRMIARGWASEGIAFCAHGPLQEGPIQFFRFNVLDPQPFQPAAECEAANGSCISLDALPTPTATYTTTAPSSFTDRTGVFSGKIYALTGDPALASSHSFFQLENTFLGAYIDSRDATQAGYLGASGTRRLATKTGGSFFPFSGLYDGEVELVLSTGLHVHQVVVRAPGSHAYGHPTIEFRDRGSGHSFFFNVLAYGTLTVDDSAMRDAKTGKAIVATNFSRSSAFGRSTADTTLATPSGFGNGDRRLGDRSLQFRIRLPDFQRILQAARTMDPALSSDPADYFVESFRFKNEVLGDAAVGLGFSGPELRLVPAR